MAIRHFGGFETGLYDAESGYTSSTPSAFSIETSIVKTGVYSLKCNYPSGSNGDWMDFTAVSASSADWVAINSARAWFKFEFRFSGLPSSNVAIAYCVDSTESLKSVLQLTTSGTLRLLQSNGSTVIATGSTVLSGNTWYRIAWRPGTGSGGNNGYVLTLNGASELSGTNNNQGSNNVGSFRIGRPSAASVAMLYYVDDFVIEDGSNEPGDWGVVALKPNGNGTHQSWTSPAATNVDNFPPNTGQYWQRTAAGSNVANTAALESSSTAGVVNTIRAAAAYVVCQANALGAGGGEEEEPGGGGGVRP